jgi:hypothetical protein
LAINDGIHPRPKDAGLSAAFSVNDRFGSPPNQRLVMNLPLPVGDYWYFGIFARAFGG